MSSDPLRFPLSPESRKRMRDGLAKGSSTSAGSKSRHVADEWSDETPRDFARQSLGKSGAPLIYPSSFVLHSLSLFPSLFPSPPPSSPALCLCRGKTELDAVPSVPSCTPSFPETLVVSVSRIPVTFNRTNDSRLNFSLARRDLPDLPATSRADLTRRTEAYFDRGLQ